MVVIPRLEIAKRPCVPGELFLEILGQVRSLTDFSLNSQIPGTPGIRIVTKPRCRSVFDSCMLIAHFFSCSRASN